MALANQSCADIEMLSRPRSTSSPTSQAVIGERKTSILRSRASRNACTAAGASRSSCTSQISAQVSSSRVVTLILAPIRVGRLGQIDARRHEGYVLQDTNERVVSYSPKHQSATGQIDMFAFEACVEPDTRHRVIRRVVAPPRLMLVGRWWKLDTCDALHIGKRQLHPLAVLLTEKIAKGFVLRHGCPLHIPPTDLYETK